MIDGYALNLLEKLCEAVEKLNEGLSQRVVSALVAKCPECHEDCGIFMVHSDKSIAVRCTNIGCYKPNQVLLGDPNCWVETDVHGNVYE